MKLFLCFPCKKRLKNSFYSWLKLIKAKKCREKFSQKTIIYVKVIFPIKIWKIQIESAFWCGYGNSKWNEIPIVSENALETCYWNSWNSLEEGNYTDLIALEVRFALRPLWFWIVHNRHSKKPQKCPLEYTHAFPVARPPFSHKSSSIPKIC